MTWPQFIIACWLISSPFFDFIAHRKTIEPISWWIGRIIGHLIAISLLTYVLHWGGFW